MQVNTAATIAACPKASTIACHGDANKQPSQRGATMDDTDLDDLILSFVDDGWRKTLDIIEQTLRACATDGLDPGARMIGNRIAALVEDGQLEAVGEGFDWRTASVRLTPTPAE